jgi:hypothetical protein
MSARAFSTSLLGLSPVQRFWLLVTTDVLLIGLAVWLSFLVRLVNPILSNFQQSLCMLAAALLIGYRYR